MLTSATDANMRKMYEEAFVQMQPLQDILNNITGEFAVAGSWSKENGFGILVAGEHASAIKVADTNKKLKSFLAVFEVPITNQNGISVMPKITEDAEFPFQPAWMAKNTTWFCYEH